MSSPNDFWQIIDGHKLKLLYKAGVSWLSQHVDTINRMNVFPVPDGDTGINMYHTLKRAYEEIELLDTDDISVVANRFAYGTLMGARGNSGTILSQLLKGFSDGLDGTKTMHQEQLLVALKNAVKLAYQSVQEPIEGTILTVARESVENLNESYQTETMFDDMLEKLTNSAETSLNNTPNLLPVLKDAGVVDSGGMGLFVFLQGMLRYRNGEEISEFVLPENLATADEASEWENALIPEDEDGYGYDVQFLMQGEAMDVAQVRADFENMGWSTLVIGDESMLKVHIHVHNPADPFNYAIGLGAELDDIVVENMHRQYEEYVRNRQKSQPKEVTIPEHGIAVISVASGQGITAVFNDLNCTHVISGGQTMNPSAEDFLNVVNALPTDKIILLPNNSNIILTAKQTATMTTDKTIHVIPTKTIMQGISAMIAYGGEVNNTISLDDMVANMMESSDYVMSIEVTRSIRSVELDGKAIVEGHYMGIVNGKIEVTHESLDATVKLALEDISSDEYELITLYYGDEISEDTANLLIERLSNAITELEFEAVYGGQSLYPYLISAE
jgi:uncharacterized protein